MLTSIIWLSIVFALAALVLIVVALRQMSDMLLHPPRMTEGKALRVLQRTGPADVGIAEFEPLTFTVPAGEGSCEKRRELQIAAWWMPHPTPSTRTCILVHGYADSKIGALAWAPTWRDLGFNLLAIDLRAHGDSQGTTSTGGFFEAQDLERVIDLMKDAKPQAASSVALFGVSLGGATVLACAAQRDDVSAVVCDSVYAHYRRAAQNHARLIAAPLRSMQYLAIRHAERTAGADFDAVAPIHTLPRIRCPVMLIHGGNDPFVPKDDVTALDVALTARGNPRDVHWIESEAFHVLALHRDAEAYRERIRSFVNS
ncbi:MAG: alpha/beta hydrolase [Tepidisphaeraceae bacterium]